MKLAPSVSLLGVFFSLTFPAAAGTDCWTFTPPEKGKTMGSISWTDSSGFENVVAGVKISGTELTLTTGQNRGSAKLKNLDLSLPVEAEDGSPLSFSPDFLAGDGNTAVLGYITGLTNVVINPNATSLGAYCFKGCTALVRVKLGDSLESIGLDAFRADSALVTVEPLLPDSVKTLGAYAFADCSKLSGALVARGLTSIGPSATGRAFHSCAALESVDLSETALTEIPLFTFYHCTSLKSVVFPDTLTIIGNGCFEDDTSLASVTPLLPSKLTTLGNDDRPPFLNCPIEGHLVVPATLERLGTKAFRYSKIETVTAPKKGLKSIGQYAFSWNTQVTNIVLSSDTDSINGEWLYNTGTAGVEQHIYFRHLPSGLPNNLWASTKKLNITAHLPWSKQDEWRQWVASGPSGHTFTFGNATKTLPEHRNDVGTWLSSVTQNVTWWKDMDAPTAILIR